MKSEKCQLLADISTHTPHARRDSDGIKKLKETSEFQLTRLMRGVTGLTEEQIDSLVISTHTPHARRDRKCKGGSKAIAISTHTPHARRDSG